MSALQRFKLCCNYLSNSITNQRKEKNEKNLLTETKQDGNINFAADDVAKQTSKKMLKKIKKVVDKE